ncbi:MAG: bacillithiol biosynthesis deacetylase BshB1 [Bacteroidia bacterium]|nr:bacillithiol biosynthesis deacetylase BshB1 [Sphingobacteriaceae bacterium]MBK7309993.1 bacillithiol biosynthesis deacetylase BshB1 [Sphingobacteriaceae bacterium]MBK7818583.1 bacillithiol biosynthesis deacetylase BshB1 [Sphingobacteriaceae bacterium]MBP9068008.1 bacillithiol biosynthesis deacetylase BshB1 [Bacteroidia bacterium]
MKIDILAIGVHPDDVELSCTGTLLKHISLGKKVGILDLTLGELGTRGSAELRTKEAMAAAKIQGVAFRKQLQLKDGFFENNEASQRAIIEVIRESQPEIILCNAISDRHPDHGRAAQLTADACFYSGLVKIETLHNGSKQTAWRPKAVYHYIQDQYIKPDFVVDVTEFRDKKHEAIMAFSSQFYDPNSKEAETPISGKDFLDIVDAKMMICGRSIGVKYAEGFTASRYIGVKDLFDLL